MHDGMQYDPIQGQGHEPFKVVKAFVVVFVEAAKGKVDLKSMMLLVRGKKFCIVKDGLFYMFEKGTSRKPSCAFPLQGTPTIWLDCKFVVSSVISVNP